MVLAKKVWYPYWVLALVLIDFADWGSHQLGVPTDLSPVCGVYVVWCILPPLLQWPDLSDFPRIFV